MDARPSAVSEAWPGDLPGPAALGATVVAEGTRFGLWSPGATRVELVLVAEDSRTATASVDLAPAGDGSWQTTVAGVGPGQRYGYRVHGTWAPERGLRANPAKLLVDPWARAVTGDVDLHGPVRDHVPGRTSLRDERDSLGSVPLSVVVAPVPRPEPLAGPRSEDLVVYETHVRGATRLHPDVPEALRGTYAGMGHPAVVQHLQRLGVTAVELLPVHHFVSEPHLVERGLVNYWGYNTLGFFAPHAGYSSRGSTGGQVQDFADMVTALHRAGIEVLLDVVLNHTCEGDQTGPTLCFRGMAGSGWYRLDATGAQVDTTGCGNSVDTSSPGVLAFLLDCLRYWVEELGVDGFRFDLASTLLRDEQHRVDLAHPFLAAVRADPVLSGVRLVSESWDVGHDGYEVGSFGTPWLEWNDRYRGLVRDFWRGRADGVRELATRLRGSADLFDPAGRPVASTVNFVTAHDGFTLRDLVSYEHKHNAANGEHNRDGSDDNRSVNHGVEGETEDPAVQAARRRHVRHLLATLLLSAGTPMITAGDELGRTQGGNNNAYCHDSEVSWTDWSDPWEDVLETAARLLRLRREHPLLRPTARPHGDPVLDDVGRPAGRPDLAWLRGGPDPAHPAGVAVMDHHAWHEHHRRLLGMYLSGVDEALLVWFSADESPAEVTLPGGAWGTGWEVLLDTTAGARAGASSLHLPRSGVVVLRGSV
ncbi:glycogen debranching protein GlgX [Auraticoccus monumenti]|uniref:Glycogen operon protein n=1 Tax=Auraticoccus monumenti TaxID=675864 RepID=A0A1G7B1R9_9ACTN|nr:glycogen debranching protein GlgX [Auraticoccus monumenti]SDE20882.1 glycogen operon protein [Auraticoccus monumenti]